ncbi:dihydrofolate reductase family protein [Puerhibacterium sp. TATVAM-FAB25]|uniref:dihydrofolate reductase family protein n=1 Tax=Puerhibacterium sp. TATVAM-FAB25 TaxID=3093699 RepID=UPI003978C2B3
MTRVIGDITVSLDGFVTGPDPGPERGLGRGGEPLHAWVFSDDPVDREVVAAATERSGAVIMGRRLFDVVDGPHGWTDEVGYGARHAAKPPFFVLTAVPPASVRLQLDLDFVTDGAEAAVARARAAASGRGDVVVMGGGTTVGSLLAAGLLDALVLHWAPLTLGAGTPLFDEVGAVRLAQRWVRPSSDAVHVEYDVVV